MHREELLRKTCILERTPCLEPVTRGPVARVLKDGSHHAIRSKIDIEFEITTLQGICAIFQAAVPSQIGRRSKL